MPPQSLLPKVFSVLYYGLITLLTHCSDFYAHTMRLYRLEELERLASTGGLKYQVDEVNEDSGLDNALDLARVWQYYYIMPALTNCPSTQKPSAS